MIAGASSDLRDDALKTQITQLQFINEGINDPDGIVFCDVFIESFGK